MRFLLFLSLFITSLQSAANPQIVEHLDWRTLETAHFRLHYTPEYRDWALASAQELENSRALLLEQQDRAVPEIVDVVVFDPLNVSNGYALPFKYKPFMGLYATPPQSDSQIGNVSSWPQLLALHEYVHLVHLTQLERDPFKQRLGEFFDLYDVSSIDSPRWAIEGYATLLESKLTGSGRLFSGPVEALLLQFAREGALPSYGELSQTKGRYLIGNMAYLVGSRFLHWLEQNYSEADLDAVWTRLRAKQERNFDEAVKGIFHKTPQQLYRRFVAEYIAKALATEQEQSANDPKLWLDLQWHASAPTISPNGEKLAIVRADKDGKRWLDVFSTKENGAAKAAFDSRIKRIQADDPVDVPAKPPAVFPRQRLQRLYEQNQRNIADPRWLSDSQILYRSVTPDAQGLFHQDLYLWDLNSGRTRAITSQQNLRRFDVHPSGNYVIAERNRFGKSQLVRVQLSDGAITPIADATLEQVIDFPRFNPQQPNQLALVSSSLNKKWQLQLLKLDSGEMQNIPLPQGYQSVSYPNWSADGQFLYFVATVDNRQGLYRTHIESGAVERVAEGKTPLSWPQPTADGQILLLSINSEGPDVLSLDIASAALAQVATSPGNESVKLAGYQSDYQLPAAQVSTDSSIGKERDYGSGPRQWSLTFGNNFNTSSFSALEVGIKGGDPLQRLDWQLNGSHSIGNGGLSGINGQVRWQGWPLKITAHAFDIDIDATLQTDGESAFAKTLTGGYVNANYPLQFDALHITPRARVNYLEQDDIEQQVFTLGVSQRWGLDRVRWGIYQRAEFDWLNGDSDGLSQIGTAVDDSWHGFDASLVLGGQFRDWYLEGQAKRHRRIDSEQALISVGGFASTLFQPDAHPNRVLTTELAFDRLQSNDYRYYQLGLRHDNVPAWLIYGRHDSAGQSNVDVYGLKGAQAFNVGVVGLNDLRLDYGLLTVNPEARSSELEAWIGVWYGF